MAYDDENDNDDVLGFGSEQDASQEDGGLSTDDLINMAQVTPEEEEETKKDIFSRMEESAGQNPAGNLMMNMRRNLTMLPPN